MRYFSLIVLFIALITVTILIARYSYQVATRTGRSRVGFVWLSILFPAVAWIVCLVLDKDESRYERLLCGWGQVDRLRRRSQVDDVLNQNNEKT
jgi:steroid 5-alpha reductase family enzyme